MPTTENEMLNPTPEHKIVRINNSFNAKFDTLVTDISMNEFVEIVLDSKTLQQQLIRINAPVVVKDVLNMCSTDNLKIIIASILYGIKYTDTDFTSLNDEQIMDVVKSSFEIPLATEIYYSVLFNVEYLLLVNLYTRFMMAVNPIKSTSEFDDGSF